MKFETPLALIQRAVRPLRHIALLEMPDGTRRQVRLFRRLHGGWQPENPREWEYINEALNLRIENGEIRNMVPGLL